VVADLYDTRENLPANFRQFDFLGRQGFGLRKQRNSRPPRSESWRHSCEQYRERICNQILVRPTCEQQYTSACTKKHNRQAALHPLTALKN